MLHYTVSEEVCQHRRLSDSPPFPTTVPNTHLSTYIQMRSIKVLHYITNYRHNAMLSSVSLLFCKIVLLRSIISNQIAASGGDKTPDQRASEECSELHVRARFSLNRLCFWLRCCGYFCVNDIKLDGKCCSV